MAITRAQQAKQMLREGGMTKKIKGQKHMLAYITPGEAETLESLGGQKTMTPEGIPAYPPPGKGASTGKGGSGGGTGKDQTSGGNKNDGGSTARERYISDYSSKGIVKGGGKKKPGTSGKDPSDYEDAKPSKATVAKEKAKYEKQFFDKGQIPPVGSRPTSFKTKLTRYNQQKRLDAINRLQGNLRSKLQKGLIDYQTEFGPFTNVTDFSTLDDYIDEVQSVQDLVDKGFYSKDGRFSKGAIPDFSTKTGIPSADLLGEIFGGPITSDKLKDLQSQIATLEGYKTSDPETGLPSITTKELMKTYEPNRYKTVYPEEFGRSDDDRSMVTPLYIPPETPSEDETALTRNLAGLSGRIGGSLFDFTGLADGGRVAAAEGGIMDLAREEMFLGGIVKSAKKAVKSVTRGIKKIAKSPIGKAALLAAGGSYALGLGPFASGSTMFGGKLAGLGGSGFLKSSALKNFFLKDATGGFSLGNLSGKGIMSAISAASLLPFLTGPKEEEDEFDIDAYYAANRLNPNAQLNRRIMGTQFAADGGRIGYASGTIPSFREYLKKEGLNLDELDANIFSIMQRAYNRDYPDRPNKLAEGGKPEPVAKKTMPLLDMDGQEMDLRAEGGFVPIGRMEKADDVPARLSKNEFVFTADAVRNAGDGNVDKGAEVMYNMMKNLESGGDVSEESQGLEGARKMFQTSQRLGEVI